MREGSAAVDVGTAGAGTGTGRVEVLVAGAGAAVPDDAGADALAVGGAVARSGTGAGAGGLWGFTAGAAIGFAAMGGAGCGGNAGAVAATPPTAPVTNGDGALATEAGVGAAGVGPAPGVMVTDCTGAAFRTPLAAAALLCATPNTPRFHSSRPESVAPATSTTAPIHQSRQRDS